jgi:hypothetical protein
MSHTQQTALTYMALFHYSAARERSNRDCFAFFAHLTVTLLMKRAFLNLAEAISSIADPAADA